MQLFYLKLKKILPNSEHDSVKEHSNLRKFSIRYKVIDCGSLQVLELVDSSLSVALPDLTKCLVFVTSLTYVLFVQFVHTCLLLHVTSALQVMLKSLKTRENINKIWFMVKVWVLPY